MTTPYIDDREAEFQLMMRDSRFYLRLAWGTVACVVGLFAYIGLRALLA